MFSLWEDVQKPGSEPPLHVHHASDETFYILEGAMRFLIGDTRYMMPGRVTWSSLREVFRTRSK